MFSQTPDIYVKSDKENKKIFTLFNDSRPNILNEISMNINKSHITHNSIILTKDNKIILCNRRLSFYASYIVHLFNKDFKQFDIKRFIKCVKTLNVKEFAVLYYTLNKKGIINIQDYVNFDVYEFIYNFKDIKPFIDIPYEIFIIYPVLIDKLTKILIDFANNILILPNSNNTILPGGKKKFLEETSYEVLKRELKEELNLNICDVKYLNEYYEFKNINEDIKPVLCMYNHDKILNYNYLDLTYIIKISKTFNEIKMNFKRNVEIFNLYPSITIKFDNEELKINNIRYLLKIFIKYIN